MTASTISNIDTKEIKKGDVLYQAEFVSNKLGEDADILIHEVNVIAPVPGRKGWFKVKIEGSPEKNSNLAYGHFKTQQDAVQSLIDLFSEMTETAKRKLDALNHKE